MTKFNLFLLTFLLSLLVILTACDSSENKEETDIKICPQCNMKLPESNIHTSTLNNNGDLKYFDDIGCMILFAHKNKIDLKTVKTTVFTNDTKRYISGEKAFYKIDEKTPMMYGFSAYENKKENCIDFNEVQMRMLRGEHMANPKIRKHILGY